MNEPTYTPRQVTEMARTSAGMAELAARNAADRADRGPGGREIALAITKLQEAQMWLGVAAKAQE